jgi:hypothetical protein
VRTAPVRASGRTGSTGKFPPVLRNTASPHTASPDRRQPIGVKDHAANQCLLAARRHHVTPGGTGRQKGRGWGRGGRPPPVVLYTVEVWRSGGWVGEKAVQGASGRI